MRVWANDKPAELVIGRPLSDMGVLEYVATLAICGISCWITLRGRVDVHR